MDKLLPYAQCTLAHAQEHTHFHVVYKLNVSGSLMAQGARWNGMKYER